MSITSFFVFFFAHLHLKQLRFNSTDTREDAEAGRGLFQCPVLKYYGETGQKSKSSGGMFVVAVKVLYITFYIFLLPEVLNRMHVHTYTLKHYSKSLNNSTYKEINPNVFAQKKVACISLKLYSNLVTQCAQRCKHTAKTSKCTNYIYIYICINKVIKVI